MNHCSKAIAQFGVIALVTLSGCQTSAPSGPIHLVEAVDYSQSFREQLAYSVQTTASTASKFDPDKDRLTVLRLAYNAEEILDGKVPESPARLKTLLVDVLKGYPAVSGTRSALLWKDMAQRLGKEQRPTAIALYSDGDDDENTAASRATIQAAGKQLAANTNIVYVAIYGVRVENREILRANLADLGDRLHLYDIRETNTEPLVAALNEARRPSQH